MTGNIIEPQPLAKGWFRRCMLNAIRILMYHPIQTTLIYGLPIAFLLTHHTLPRIPELTFYIMMIGLGTFSCFYSDPVHNFSIPSLIQRCRLFGFTGLYYLIGCLCVFTLLIVLYGDHPERIRFPSLAYMSAGFSFFNVLLTWVNIFTLVRYGRMTIYYRFWMPYLMIHHGMDIKTAFLYDLRIDDTTHEQHTEHYIWLMILLFSFGSIFNLMALPLCITFWYAVYREIMVGSGAIKIKEAEKIKVKTKLIHKASEAPV